MRSQMPKKRVCEPVEVERGGWDLRATDPSRGVHGVEGVEAVTTSIDIITHYDTERAASTSFAPKSASVLTHSIPHYAKALIFILYYYEKAWENDGRVQRTKFDGEEVGIQCR